MCVVRVLLIHHSKQEIVFLHPDKSSSRHLPHTGLVLCVCTGKDRHTHLQSIHAVCIYYGHVCGLLCHTMKCVWMYCVNEQDSAVSIQSEERSSVVVFFVDGNTFYTYFNSLCMQPTSNETRLINNEAQRGDSTVTQQIHTARSLISSIT